MRISGGSWRGRSLVSPSDQRVRPTSERIRQVLFNMLGEQLHHARVLDLFAGTGALGLEGLSRGAGWATFVDNHPASLKLLQTNIERCQAQEWVRVVKGSVLSPGTFARLSQGLAASDKGSISAEETLATGAGPPFDLIFLDPPYGRNLVEGALVALARAGEKLLAGEALAISPHEVEMTPPRGIDGWHFHQTRTHGSTSLTFWRWGRPEAGRDQEEQNDS
ncbi:MAG: 16S rRNA (guanine(966)-N(2))-methyltransferase RsmD [Magnetococcales bacterium]|nr:16S rRNA (guanine(966)-N(2))-methyltransferase RsmD [Magnetococcales bacterium]